MTCFFQSYTYCIRSYPDLEETFGRFETLGRPFICDSTTAAKVQQQRKGAGKLIDLDSFFVAVSNKDDSVPEVHPT